MEGWEDESPSDDDDVTNIENELYSMFYYHSMSEGIPDDLSKKYDLNVNNFGVTISLKETNNSNLDDTSLEHNKLNDNISVNLTSKNDRFIEGRCNLSNLNETTDISVDKECLDKKGKKEPMKSPPAKLSLPERIPVTEKLTPFQSMRYFSKNETKFVEQNQRNNYRTSFKDSTAPNKVPRSLILLNRIEKTLNLKWEDKIKNKNNYNVKREKSIIKKTENNIEVDLTQDLLCEELNRNISKRMKKQNKRNKNKESKIAVINISSDSETDNESVLLLSSSSELESDSDASLDQQAMNSVVLNTTCPLDVSSYSFEIDTGYDWRKTSSPEGWTESMRKFYNKPSKELVNFDHTTFLNETRDSVWKVSIADRLSIKRSRKIRCIRCNEEGHVKAKCKKVFSCYMCGTPGHNATKCPSKICLKCGSVSKEGFFNGCMMCSDQGNKFCDLCGFKGHSSKLCTDTWRTFTSAVEHNENENSGAKYCCNCAKRGHSYEECSRSKASYKFPNKRDMYDRSNTSYSHKKFPKKRSYIESNIQESHIRTPLNKRLKMKKLCVKEIDFDVVKCSKIKKALRKVQNLSSSKKMLRKLNKKRKR